jgi:dihydroxyacid dehydratase/phosphogluconate dehydratase
VLEVERTENELASRRPAEPPDRGVHGMGRELFGTLRGAVSSPEEGAISFADGGGA